MNIIYIVENFHPKLGYSSYYIPKKLEYQGHNVYVITSDKLFPGSYYSKTIYPKNEIRRGFFIEEGIPTYRLFSLYYNNKLISLGNIKAFFNKVNPDIIHSNDLFYSTTFLAMHYKNNFNYKIFVDSITGTFEPHGFNNLLFGIFKNFMSPYLKKNVDHFFAINKGTKEWLANNFKISKNLIDIIPLAADQHLFYPSTTIKRNFRKNLFLNMNSLIIIYTGKIIPSKDIHILISSFKILIDNNKNIDIKLLLIGNGPSDYITYIKKLIQIYNLNKKIIMIDFVERTELYKYYNVADIGVWPGSPSISIIEAMSTELPIIICKYPERREDAYDTSHLLEYENGLSFYRGDHVALAACVEKLVSNPTLRKEMGRNSRKLVEDKLNWDCVVAKYLEFYRKFVDK